MVVFINTGAKRRITAAFCPLFRGIYHKTLTPYGTPFEIGFYKLLWAIPDTINILCNVFNLVLL